VVAEIALVAGLPAQRQRRTEPVADRPETLERDGQLRVIEGTLTARVDPGTVRAELTLSR